MIRWGYGWHSEFLHPFVILPSCAENLVAILCNFVKQCLPFRRKKKVSATLLQFPAVFKIFDLEMNLFIFGIVLLGSSVQPQNAWAYKQEVTITDHQKGTNLRLLQMNRTSATTPSAPRSPIKPLLPIATPIYKPVAAPKKPVLNPTKPYKPSNPFTKPTNPAKPVLPSSHFDGRSTRLNPTQPFKPSSPVKPFKPSSPIQPIKPVQPLAKPVPPPFDGGIGGINTAVNWYCGNQTAKTCSSQTCSDPITGCSQNKNNYRDCLWECIPVLTTRPMKPSAKPVTSTPPSKPFISNPILSFGGGISTPVNWYCGNVTTNTCDPGRIACSDPTNGCSNNRNNYRSCLFECINGTFGWNKNKNKWTSKWELFSYNIIRLIVNTY